MIYRVISVLSKAILAKDPSERFESRFYLISGIMQRAGIHLYKPTLLWQNDQEYLQAWNAFQDAGNYIDPRKYILYSMAKSLAHIPGDTAECGVFNGGSSFLMCMANRHKEGRCHHAFDSFEGLSQPEPVDVPTNEKIYRWKKHALSASLDLVQRNLSQFDFVHYYPGWIPDAFHEVADRNFSFVHIDVDLYQPTRDSLGFFYERIVPGGIILCDDYGHAPCPGAKKACDEFFADKPERPMIHLTTGQGFIVKRCQ
jgi:hypothetical protein